MIGFDLSDTQTALQTTYAERAKALDLGTLAAQDASGHLDLNEWRGIWQQIADTGILGLAAPQDFDGAAQGIVTCAAALHGFGEGCVHNGLLLAIGAKMWTVIQPIVEFGTLEQCQRYIPDLIAGRIIGSDGVTEATAGSDAMTLNTTARADGDDYILNGEKIYVGLAPLCDVALVFASTAPEKGAWGISAFLVDMSLRGATRGGHVDKAGLRSIPTGRLTFDNVRLPASARLGAEGAGRAIFGRASEWERQMIFAGHVGGMKRQLDQCVAHARSRTSGGVPINTHQSVSNRIADMRLRYETTWLMQLRGAWQMDQQRSTAAQAALTKLHISEALLASSIDALRTMGGAGYYFEADPARDLRDAMGGVILGGTSDIQRQIIAAMLGR